MSDLTMKELAELAGLDISTVSRALRGDSKRVAASTITRVQRLAHETGFVTDPVASSLRSGRSRMLGVIVHSLDDIVMGLLVTAIDEASSKLGYLSTVVATHDDPDARTQAISRLLSRRVDGLILCDSPAGRETPERLKSADVPYVFAMRGADDGVSVTADDYEGGRLVANHFMDSGHTNLAVVPGPAHARTARDRAAGFIETAASRPGVSVVPAQGAGGFGVEDGYHATAALLASGAKPTALFCTNDHTAIGASKALAEAKLRVGIDVALVGYNDIPQAAYLETPLSSVRTDVERMGATAAQALAALVEGGTAESTLLTPTLIVRASSDPDIFTPKQTT